MARGEGAGTSLGTVMNLGTCILCLFVTLSPGSCATVLSSARDLGVPEKTVALSFDDGPCEVSLYDMQLLDVPKERNIKASFCLL